VHREPLVLKVFKDPQAQFQMLLVLSGPLDRLVLRVLLVLKDLKVFKELSVSQDLLVRIPMFQALKDRQAPVDRLVLLDLLELLQIFQALLDPLDQLENSLRPPHNQISRPQLTVMHGLIQTQQRLMCTLTEFLLRQQEDC
jgi:hypothetical protein